MPSVTTLTPQDLDFGKHISEELKKSGFPFNGVFWLYDEDSDDWQLVIATDLVDKEGPRETYLRLANAISKVPGSDFQLMRVTVMSPRTPVYNALRSVFGTAASVEGARLHHTVVNGILVSAYLYDIS